jgi:hypothetical protein
MFECPGSLSGDAQMLCAKIVLPRGSEPGRQPQHVMGGAVNQSGTGEPESVVGKWLAPTLLGRREERDRLAAQLKGVSWYADDLEVAEIVCDLAMRRYFGPDYNVRDVTALASLLREIVGDDLDSGVGVMEIEAVLRSALGETDVNVSGIKPAERFKVHSFASVFAVQQQGWSERDVHALIADAEERAAERGSHPQRA